LPKIYADFGSEVEFEMVPFMMGSVANPGCFDERSPCKEEQTAYCVIDVARKADTTSQFPGQDKIVQWQICASQRGSKPLESCHEQVGLDKDDVDACLGASDRIHGLMQQYIDRGGKINSTPTEQVDGKKVGGDADYAAVKKAICKEDSSLTACASIQV